MAIDLALAEALVATYPPATRKTRRGTVSFRAAGGAGAAVCLLHGIGSQSGSWVRQLEALGARFRVVAWDAPGYGQSDRLDAPSPAAADYAESLEAFLDVLDIERVVLVASSLGALMAGAFAARHAGRVASMVLLNPAGGYGAADAADRAEKLAARLGRLERLGPSGMAQDLSPGMLAPGASAEATALAAWSTAQIRPDGYTQAAHMLANGRLVEDAALYPGPVLVVAGRHDTITPAAGCERIAHAFPHGSYRLLDAAGHLSYLDSADTVNRLIAEAAA